MDYEKIRNAKQLFVLCNVVKNKAVNLGEADTPRKFKVKLSDGTIIKRNNK